jgi:hypothetical protein
MTPAVLQILITEARREFRKVDHHHNRSIRNALRAYWKKRCDDLISQQASFRHCESSPQLQPVSPEKEPPFPTA